MEKTNCTNRCVCSRSIQRSGSYFLHKLHSIGCFVHVEAPASQWYQQTFGCGYVAKRTLDILVWRRAKHPSKPHFFRTYWYGIESWDQNFLIVVFYFCRCSLLYFIVQWVKQCNKYLHHDIIIAIYFENAYFFIFCEIYLIQS